MTPTDVEQRILASWRAGEPAPPARNPDDPASWVPLALHLALLASRIVRTARLGDLDGATLLKQDGSPVTVVERFIEEQIATVLQCSAVPVALLGEETADRQPGSGFSLAVDPVDGTWSLVNRTETAATSLAVLREGEPIVGVVANPATAEFAYAFTGGSPRLLQLGALGEGDRGVTLPIPPAGPDGLLVCLHPQRASGAIVQELSRAWRDGEIDMVRAPGGSPSLGLLEAAKGNFVYVNLWNRRASEAWDLSAGLMLVRCAGGDVVDLDGRSIQHIGHRGPLIAGLNGKDREQVAHLIRHALASEGGG